MDRFLVIDTTLAAAAWLQVLVLPDSLIARLGATMREWRVRARSRRELSRLDAHQLKDIGLTPSQAAFESDKSFLQA